MRGLISLAFFSSLWLSTSAVPVSEANAMPVALPDGLYNGGVNALLNKRAKYGLFSSDWCFDANTISNPRWMSKIPDATKISKISIPGTHDTMTWDADLGIVGAQCQNKDLKTQLNAGIRYLDLRAWLLAGDLQTCHGPALLGWTLRQNLEMVFDWLEANPTEGLIVRLREENPPSLSGKKTFIQKFEEYLNNSGDFSKRFDRHLWRPSAPGSNTLPTLGELRGKLVFLQNFGSGSAQYGIRWAAGNFKIEDTYDAGPINKLKNTKWPLIQANIQRSLADNSGNTMYMTHLSASTSVPPLMAAAGLFIGPLIQHKGMNQLTGEWLTGSVPTNQGKNVGVLMMDFVGAKLISRILAYNAHLNTK